jgi:hypothetical protein
MHDNMDPLDQVSTFLVGISPRATHTGYFDLSMFDPQEQVGPSVGFACNLCGGVAAAEVTKILLGRGKLRPVPCYGQFDAYRGLLRRGRIPGGNRNPLQRLKRYLLRRQLQKLGYGANLGR